MTRDGTANLAMEEGGSSSEVTPLVDVERGGRAEPAFLRQLNFLRVLPKDVLITGGVCALLSLQNSTYTLLRRYSSGVLHETASSASILAAGELLKLSFSIAMISSDQRSLLEHEQPAKGGLLFHLRRLALSSAAMAVPALIFLAMNLLSFVALSRISASAFTLIQQTKIIFTAVLARLLLSKELSRGRWRALLTLFCAVLTICHETSPKSVPSTSGSGNVCRSPSLTTSTRTHTLSLTHALSHSLSHSPTHLSHTLSLSHALSPSTSRALTHSLSHTLTHTLTHTLSLSLTHTPTSA